MTLGNHMCKSLAKCRLLSPDQLMNTLIDASSPLDLNNCVRFNDYLYLRLFRLSARVHPYPTGLTTSTVALS